MSFFCYSHSSNVKYKKTILPIYDSIQTHTCTIYMCVFAYVLCEMTLTSTCTCIFLFEGVFGTVTSSHVNILCAQLVLKGACTQVI